MGKVLFTRKNADADINYVAGRVSYVREGTGAMEGKVVNIGMTITVYNRETKENEKKYLSVGFFNSDQSALADMVKNAKVRAGSFILMTVGTLRDQGTANDGTPRVSAYGFSFDYSCAREIKSGDKTYMLIAGSARNIQDDESRSQIRFSIPASVYDRAEKKNTTVWYGVTAQNSERRNLYNYAKSLIVDGSAVALLCSAVRETEKGGRTYRNCLMFDAVAQQPESKE